MLKSYNGKIINSLSDLMNSDESKSGEKEKCSEKGEGRAADELLKLPQAYNQDSKTKGTLSNMINSGKGLSST